MKPIYLAVPAGILLVVISIVVSLGMTAKPPAPSTRATQDTSNKGISFDGIRDLLHRAADYDDCRGAVQQLNLYVEGAEEKPRGLSHAEKEALQNKDLFGLDESELTEVNRTTFTPLDAHHLELCLLLHEALSGLHLDKLSSQDQAAAGFAWVMRQVQWQERPGDALPPDFVLRRGYGTALERAQVFLAVLQQLGLDGCMLAVPGKPGEPSLRYWLPGALIGNEIYLFDTRLGFPLPGPKGKDVTTLSQVRGDREILRQLTVDDKTPYDISQDQAKQAEIHIACTLSALAPRMRYLEDKFSSADRVQLGVDPLALTQRFAAAVKTEAMKGVPVRVWNLPGDLSSPIRVLRNFVPEDEGGVDKSYRREQWKQQLIPGQYFPRQLDGLDEDPRRLMQLVYAFPFAPFYTQAKLKREFLIRWLPGVQQVQQGKPGQPPKQSELLQRDRMPRDLLLRGRFREATGELSNINDELKRQLQIKEVPGLDAQIEQWVADANAQFRALQQAGLNGGGKPNAAKASQNAAQALSSQGRSDFGLAQVVQAAAAEPMSAQVTYFVALCKQEEAERAQARLGKSDNNQLKQLWESAASWWATVLDNHGSDPGAGSARLLLARTRQAVGRPDEAVAILQEQASKAAGLEKVACLYLARQWKAR
jgi:hypothetical protein